MTVTLHDDVKKLIDEEAATQGITFDEAANFMIRFSTMHKPLMVERDLLTLASDGTRLRA